MSKEGFSRRRFLTVAGTAAGAAVASQLPFSARARTAPVRFTGYPFTLGVASGDPTPDGAVLWTRLAPAPLSGNGGMPDKPVAVQWEVANDEAFAQRRRARRRDRRGGRRALGPRRAAGAPARPRVLLPVQSQRRDQSGGSHQDRAGGGGERAGVRVRLLPAVRARLLHGLQAHGRGGPGPRDPRRRLHLRVRHRLVHLDRRERPRQLQPRDRQPRRLPRAPRPVQDRPGPAGRARRVPVAGDVRRPRGRQQLGRRDPRGGDAARLVHAPAQGRVPRLLGAHAAAQGGQADRHQHPDLPARRVREPGHVPRARHAPVPLRPEQRPDEPGAHDHRGAAGAVALRRTAGLAGDVAGARQPGLHGPVGLRRPARARASTATPGTATRSRATSS